MKVGTYWGRRLRRLFGLFLSLAALVPAHAGEAAIARRGADAAARTADDRRTDPLAAGRAIYNFRCYFCHGYSGDAKTLAATYLTPPPANFRAARATALTRQRIEQALQTGRPGSAMKSFASILSPQEIHQVADFVFTEFVQNKRPNTRYHTAENGWPDHERYADAFPFARGEIPLTRPPERLSPAAQRGRKLYLGGCVTCHDRGKPADDPVTWDPRPLSYPRINYDHRAPEIDATTSATPYRLHDTPRPLTVGNARARQGETLFQENCAFCHAADGSGKNWIGAFLEPHPRDLSAPEFMRTMTRERLRERIRDGIPGSSMPAWKHVLDDTQIDAIIAYIDAALAPIGNGAPSQRRSAR